MENGGVDGWSGSELNQDAKPGRQEKTARDANVTQAAHLLQWRGKIWREVRFTVAGTTLSYVRSLVNGRRKTAAPATPRMHWSDVTGSPPNHDPDRSCRPKHALCPIQIKGCALDYWLMRRPGTSRDDLQGFLRMTIRIDWNWFEAKLRAS